MFIRRLLICCLFFAASPSLFAYELPKEVEKSLPADVVKKLKAAKVPAPTMRYRRDSSLKMYDNSKFQSVTECGPTAGGLLLCETKNDYARTQTFHALGGLVSVASHAYRGSGPPSDSGTLKEFSLSGPFPPDPAKPAPFDVLTTNETAYSNSTNTTRIKVRCSPKGTPATPAGFEKFGPVLLYACNGSFSWKTIAKVKGDPEVDEEPVDRPQTGLHYYFVGGGVFLDANNLDTNSPKGVFRTRDEDFDTRITLIGP